MRSRMVIFLFIMCACMKARALDGISVSTSFYGSGAIAPANSPIGLPGWLLRPAGTLVKFTVAASRTTRSDTLVSYDKGMVQCPALNLEGTKVVFFLLNTRCTRNAQGIPVYPPASSGQYGNLFWNDTTRISVIDIDGNNLTNLAQFDMPNNIEEGEEYAGLDWPAGDWVYYEKPTKSHEIWRVNVIDKRNELVVKIKGDDSNAGDLYIRRFGLSLDTRLMGLQTLGYDVCTYYNNIASCFPPENGNLTSCLPADCGSNGCNMAVSASGHYYSHYLYAGHQHVYVRYWNGSATGNINSSDSGIDTRAGAEWMRYAVNSDKILLQWIAKNGATGAGGWGCADQYCVNTVSREVFAITSNSGGWCNDPGDFRVACAPENVGKYETRGGAWTTVTPVLAPALTIDNPGTVTVPPTMAPGLAYAAGARSGVTPELTLDVRGNWSSGVQYSGYIKIDRPGAWRFLGAAEGGFSISVNNTVVVSQTPAEYAHDMKWGQATLSAGLVPFGVTYTDGNVDYMFLYCEGPDGVRRRISGDLLYHQGQTGVAPAARSRGVGAEALEAYGDGHTLHVRVMPGQAHDLGIISMQGRVLFSQSGAGSCDIPLSKGISGYHLVVLRTMGRSIARPVFFARQ